MLPSKELRIQFTKYMSGGALYFFVGYGVFAIFYSGLKWSLIPAKLMGDVIGWSLNYIVQRYWAFDSEHLRLSEMQHMGRYMAIESIGFVIDYAMIVGLKAVGVTPYIGLFISAAFFSVWSYLWYKHWVFPEKRISTKNVDMT